VIGGAIVREPKAFLLDEPLSNLDAKLRVAMRAELSRLHARLGTATVYVLRGRRWPPEERRRDRSRCGRVLSGNGPAVDFAVHVSGASSPLAGAPQSSPARSALSCHPPEGR
jgi:hypothetical protein